MSPTSFYMNINLFKIKFDTCYFVTPSQNEQPCYYQCGNYKMNAFKEEIALILSSLVHVNCLQ
jgi:hypothetical protein